MPRMRLDLEQNCPSSYMYVAGSEAINKSSFYFQIYYVLAMVEDLVLRAAWTLNISVGEAGAGLLTQDALLLILGCLEVFRWVGSQCLFV